MTIIRHIACCAVVTSALTCTAQPLVYFDFVTHNEETGQWNGNVFYMANRARLIQLADHFQPNGITWNMQSDWVYLTNVLTKETVQVTMNTGGKNIQRWLHEDRGVELDPHAHESQYIYPDVVALMDSIGLPESKVIGGTLYNDFNGMNLWTNLVYGQYGIVFPNRFWQPDYMMGGGTMNHVNDLKYYGFWNPQDTANYLTHDPNSPLHHIGVGCSIRVQDTTSVAYVMAQVNEVIDNVQAGVYPDTGFYFQTIFFEQAGLNDAAFYQKVLDVADSTNALVNTGVAEWKTFKQVYTLWDSVYNAQVFQWECGQEQVITAVAGMNAGSTDLVVPTFFTDHIVVKNASGRETYVLRTALGNLVLQGGHIENIDVSDVSAGTYLLTVSVDGVQKTFTVVKE